MNRKLVLTISSFALVLATAIAFAPAAMAHGPWGGFGGAERDADLAAALDLSVDELMDARQKAMDARLDRAVESGQVTQEQADLMRAGQKLAASLDRQAILADALGITPAALEAAKNSDEGLRGLYEGQDRATLAEKLKASEEKAMAKAVTDGVISQAEADALKAAAGERQGRMGHGMRGFGMMRGFGEGGCMGKKGGMEHGGTPGLAPAEGSSEDVFMPRRSNLGGIDL
jgi:hypothetical protein